MEPENSELKSSGFCAANEASPPDEIPEIEKLRRFKAYVHRRLDEAGVPVDPESPHKADGCRIGGRLDIVLSEYGSNQAKRAR